MALSTGCKAIDELLNGGFEEDTLTVIYGEGGSGKTNICLQVARNSAREGKKVIYVDTEGVSLERLRQMCEDRGDFDSVLSNLLIYSPFSLAEQEAMLKKAIKLASGKTPVGVVIVDSITTYYRLELALDDGVDEKRILAEELHALVELARKKSIPVIATSQVYGAEEQVKPIGGHALWHMAKTILLLEKTGVGRRRMTIMKHRSLPEGAFCEFSITHTGLE